LHFLLDMTKDAIEEGNVFELNIMWPDMGVIHFNVKSDGLLNFMRHLGAIPYKLAVDEATKDFEDEDNEDMGKYSLVDAPLIDIAAEADDYL